MGWRSTIVFKPLIGEQTFIENFYSEKNPFRSENNKNRFYLHEYKGYIEDMCHTVTKEYPGITFIGYAIHDNTCGEFSVNQIMFNKRDNIIFCGPEYDREIGEQDILFDEDNDCIIRGIQNGRYEYDAKNDKQVEVEPGSIWKRTDIENSAYSINRPDNCYKLDVTTEINELVDCIIEEYRIKIGITDSEYNKLKEGKLQHGFLVGGTIIRGDFRTEIYSPNTTGLSRFQTTIILKKTISDLDWLLIKKLRETDNIKEVTKYAGTIDVNSIWEEHEKRFREKNGSVWERIQVQDTLF